MAIKQGEQWFCSECQKPYPDQFKADACRDSHELIYVPFTKTELNRILNFIYSREEKLITPALVNKINKYLRGK